MVKRRAQQMAAQSDPKTTRLYDRCSDKAQFDEVERISISGVHASSA